jgi:photosystem II stability/assembly factor-like uncharacterized protein
VAKEIARDEATERARVAELPSETAAGVAATPAPVDRLQAPMFARQARSVVEFTSPDPLTRWRLAGMSIQRSGDGGKTWSETVVTHAEVRAGASPSANVAWIVGHGGLVMRTTDGGVWKRLEFPDAADLVSVRAASALGADVTAADGRVFRTTDGGVTWVLQENPGSAF